MCSMTFNNSINIELKEINLFDTKSAIHFRSIVILNISIKKQV